MALKDFFKGKSAWTFWGNIVLMVMAIVAVPTLTFYLLDQFTHHGEKIEVPNVLGKSQEQAEEMLRERGLKPLVSDSAYDKRMAPGAVLAQSPEAGYEVKGDRAIYLTMNLHGVPMVQMPPVVGQGTLRETVALLQSMGFKLTPHERVMGHPQDLVLSVKQGGRQVHAGQQVPRDRALTIVVGGGEIDTLRVDSAGGGDAEPLPDFDIEL